MHVYDFTMICDFFRFFIVSVINYWVVKILRFFTSAFFSSRKINIVGALGGWEVKIQ